MPEEIIEKDEVKEVKIKKWGNPLGVVSLVFGIIALFFGLLSLIPLLGIVLAWIAFVNGFISVAFGIPAVIGSNPKTVSIVGLSFGGLMMIWGILRYLWAAAIIASV